jgi:hypothetical protein
LSFAVRLRRERDTWTLELETRRESGAPSTRTLEGKSCNEVTNAAAVVIGLSIRDSVPAAAGAVTETPPPAAAENPGDHSEQVAEPSPAVHPASQEPARRLAHELAAVVTLAGILDTASLPGPALGVALSGGARYAGFAFEVQGTALVPQMLELGAGQSAEFNLLAGALFVCLTPGAASLTLLACAGLELGRMSGEGHGVTNPKLGSALWDAVRLDLGGELPLSANWRLSARVGLMLPVSRPEFQLDGQDIYRPAALGFRAGLGVELWP